MAGSWVGGVPEGGEPDVRRWTGGAGSMAGSWVGGVPEGGEPDGKQSLRTVSRLRAPAASSPQAVRRWTGGAGSMAGRWVAPPDCTDT
jgi:hypothetical protein